MKPLRGTKNGAIYDIIFTPRGNLVDIQMTVSKSGQVIKTGIDTVTEEYGVRLYDHLILNGCKEIA